MTANDLSLFEKMLLLLSLFLLFMGRYNKWLDKSFRSAVRTFLIKGWIHNNLLIICNKLQDRAVMKRPQKFTYTDTFKTSSYNGIENVNSSHFKSTLCPLWLSVAFVYCSIYLGVRRFKQTEP